MTTGNTQGDAEQLNSRVCRIHLVRHGQTAMNVENRFRGRLDVPLSTIGRAEAWEAARRLQGVGLSVVYTSPLGRAREVAEAIATTSQLAAVREHDGLVNLEYGRWEGLTRQECADADPADWQLYADDPEEAVCPDGESLAAAADRMVAALQEIGRAHRGETVAAVSHGAMLRLAVLRVAPPIGADWQFELPTGSALAFDVDGETITLVSRLDRTVAKREAEPGRLERAG
jgi:broad specificity phosphatase PhoE